MAAKLKVKKGDKVVVIAGRDKGKQGEIVKALPQERRVIVSGVAVAKRHTRASQYEQGGIKEKELSIDVSNVALIDPKDDKPTRVGFKTLDDGRKVRVAKRSGEVLD